MPNGFQPFVGPRPYKKEDGSLFFGRDREANDLVSLVIAHPVVLLYAQSGAGKTSLINAKLVPMLEKEGFQAFPVARVRGLIPKGFESDKVPNLYVFNALASWADEKTDLNELTGMSLPDRLQRKPSDEDKPRVIIFDQFEELFTAYPERWRDRGEFFRQVGIALEGDPSRKTKGDPLLRVVFAMRDDYIAELAPYADFLPEKLRTRFRMERLRTEAALAAVKGPLQQSGCAFAEGVAEKLVDDLLRVRVQTAAGSVEEVAGEFIEPVQLQVICANLWQNLPPHTKLITSEHLQEFGDVNEALKDFYEEAISAAVREASVEEELLRNWFKSQLITAAETRGTVFRDSETTGGLPNEAVDVLENRHLIRAELRSGARWYELTHDRFIRPINACNRIWFQRAERGRLERERIEAEQRAAKDAVEKEKETARQREQENAETVAREREAGRQRELKQAQDLADEQKQRAEEKAKLVARLRRLLAAVVTLSVIAISVALYANYKRREANDEKMVADGLRSKADERTVEAKKSKLKDRQSIARVVAGDFVNAAARVYSAPGQVNTNLMSGSQAKSLLFAWQAAQASKQVGHPSQRVEDALRRALLTPLFSTNAYGIAAIEFDADGKRLATVNNAGVVSLWDTVSKSQITNFLTTGESRPAFFTFNRGASHVIAVGTDGSGYLYKLSLGTNYVAKVSGIRVRNPDSFSGFRSDRLAIVAINGNAERVAFVGLKGEVQVQDTKPEQPTPSPQQTKTNLGASLLSGPTTNREDQVVRLVFNPSTNRLAALRQGGIVSIYDVQRLAELTPVQAGREGFVSGGLDLAWSPDGQWLVTSDSEGTIAIWNATNGEPKRKFPQETATWRNRSLLAFDANGARLGVFTTTRDGPVVRILDAESGVVLSNMPLPQFRFDDMAAFNPTLQSLAIARDDRIIEVYPLRSIEKPVDEAGKSVAKSGGELSLEDYASALDEEIAPGLHSGLEHARAGRVEEAIKQLRTVPDLPGVRFDSTNEVYRLVANKLLSEARSTALKGDVEQAIRKYQEAKSLDARLPINPEKEARRFASQAALENAYTQARAGDTNKAFESFKVARNYDPRLDLAVFEAKVRQMRAEELLRRGMNLVYQNKILEAANAFAEAQMADPQFTIPAYAWNQLCWVGSLAGYATQVLFAGDKAVEMNQKDAGFRDTRGLARALSGDVRGATNDFQFYVDESGRSQPQLDLRRDWIKQLSEGRKPNEVFTKEKLEKLRD